MPGIIYFSSIFSYVLVSLNNNLSFSLIVFLFKITIPPPLSETVIEISSFMLRFLNVFKCICSIISFVCSQRSNNQYSIPCLFVYVIIESIGFPFWIPLANFGQKFRVSNSMFDSFISDRCLSRVLSPISSYGVSVLFNFVDFIVAYMAKGYITPQSPDKWIPVLRYFCKKLVATLHFFEKTP